MAYKKTEWKARKGSNLSRFSKEQETTRSVILFNEPSQITEEGTPFSVENMNNIEQGIYDAHEITATEIKERQTADHALQQAIITETENRQTTNQLLQQNINNETEARLAAVVDIRNIINTLTGLPEWDPDNHIITFTAKDGSTLTVDIPLENLTKDIDFDPETKEIILFKHDGTEIRIDVSDLVDVYTGSIGTHIQITVGEDNQINAILRAGSVTETELSAALQARLDGFAKQADMVAADQNLQSQIDTINQGGGVNLELIKWALFDFEHPVGDIQVQYPNGLSPVDKGWGEFWQVGQSITAGRRLWEVCNSRAHSYRLRQTALPSYVTYTPGANYAVNACVMYHLDGDDWAFFTAKEALTNVPEQLDPVKWNQLKTGIIVEQRFLHAYTEADYSIGQQIIDGEYDGWYVEEVLVYGGKYFAAEGGNRPPFNSGTAEDMQRRIYGTGAVFAWGSASTGALISIYHSNAMPVGGNQPSYIAGLDTSLILKTGNENQPRTISVIYWRRVA